MTLYERIQQDLAASMKARDAERTSVLRMAKAAIMNREIEKRSAGSRCISARTREVLPAPEGAAMT